jgi:hypothetical protein
MGPAAAYRRFNKLLWNNRLPKAVVSFVEDDVLPLCYGITLFDRDFARPVIYLVASNKNWQKTLIHEMIHVSEPSLPHGKLFTALVEFYWRMARITQKKGYRTLRRGSASAREDGAAGIHDYMQHVSDAASFEAFNRHDVNPLLSAETLPESGSLIDFKAFAQEYPERLFPLLFKLRPEFVELFAEYWLLGKSQSFIGNAHGFIQTRVWQSLRIIERALGSLIVLGPHPTEDELRTILTQAKLEDTPYGSLAKMITRYATTQDYSLVAKEMRAPVPAIRKIFRPAIAQLSTSKDLRTTAVGSYLHNLTHQASLTGAGLSKRCKARNRRVKTLRFVAPPSNNSPLLSFGHADALGDTPWCMLEISSDHRMAQIKPALQPQGKKIFGKKAGQIFAPINADGELEFGYVFARSSVPSLVRKLLHIRGIAELATMCDGEGNFVKAVTISNDDVQTMIKKHNPPTNSGFRVGQFVEILTGDAKGYCGTITKEDRNGFIVQVNFPTGRCFLVRADETSLKSLSRVQVAGAKRMFWGVLGP